MVWRPWVPFARTIPLAYLRFYVGFYSPIQVSYANRDFDVYVFARVGLRIAAEAAQLLRPLSVYESGRVRLPACRGQGER